MPDIQEPKKEVTVSGEEALKVADALTATTMKMLKLLWDEPLDVSTIGKKLGLSQAYISEQVKMLEELKLLNVTYIPVRGVLEKFAHLLLKKSLCSSRKTRNNR